jgi:hypothetical protein
MSWMHDDPSRLSRSVPPPIRGDGRSDKNGADQKSQIPVAQLSSAFAASAPTDKKSQAGADASWLRFIGHVLAAFRERRGPFARTSAARDSEDPADDEGDHGDDDPEIKKSFAIFEKLLDRLLLPEHAQQQVITALDLTQYICDRLRPDPGLAREWLEKVVTALLRNPVPAKRLDDVASAIVTLLGCKGESRSAARLARQQLLLLGAGIDGPPPLSQHSQGFQQVLLQTADWATLWSRLQTIRTYAEYVRAYLSALEAGQHDFECAELAEVASEEWPTLRGALASPHLRTKILILDRWRDACPRCHMKLPSFQENRLRENSVATAKNCCSRVIIWGGA